MKKKFIAALIIIGFSGIVAQVLLLREFLVKFYGNELSVGIILANWLILEAAGAFFFGKRIEYIKGKIEAVIILQLIFSISLPLAVYLTRTFNTIIGLTHGEGLGIAGIFWSSFMLLLPVCLPHGILFTFSCKIYSLFLSKNASLKERKINAAQDAKAIGRVYIYDALGTFLGGIFFTYLFIKYFNSFQIAFCISLLNIFTCLVLLGFIPKPNKLFLARTLKISYLFLFLYTFLILKADNIHAHSLKKQWPKQNVIYYHNSVYGNVAVIEKDKQYTFLSAGIPIFASPTPDIIFTEEFAHLVLLSHPHPKKILIISGGAGGLITELLKHPVQIIDYCELDPHLIKAARTFFTPIMQSELSDRHVKINYIDGRLFLKNTNYKYDVIMIGVSNPSDLQKNRLFTKEFFLMAKGHLKENGILAITLPGSLSYLSDELRKLNACIYETLKQSLPYIKVIPGDTNIFISSVSKGIYAINPGLLVKRLKQRKLKTSLITARYIEYKLGQQWIRWFLDSVNKVGIKPNADFHPTGVFYSLSYWNALFSPHTQRAFKLLERISLSIFVIPVIALIFLYLFAGYKNKKLRGSALPYAIITTGFCGIVFDLVLIFAFQILYGFVYYWIGILITAFMLGLAYGSFKITMKLEKLKDDLREFMKLEISIIIFSFLLPYILYNIKDAPIFLSALDISKITPAVTQTILILLTFISGFLVGAEFPLCNKISLKTCPNVSRTAGLLYATDLLGGWVGGVLGGVALVPILGLYKTCILMAILKMSSFIILLFSR